MKRAILLFGFFFFSATAFSQNTLIVDNTGSAPAGDHIYTNLQDAIDAAQAGDVIQVMPSPTSYGNVEIPSTKEEITIVGDGYLSGKPVKTLIQSVTIRGNNNLISGIVVQTDITIASGSSEEPSSGNIVRKTSLQGLKIDDASNSILNSCYIGNERSSDIHSSSNGTVISNSLIKTQFATIYNSEIRKSIFYDNSNNLSNQIWNSLFVDNIFLEALPNVNSGGSFQQRNQNNVYNNNYSLTSIPIGEGGNTGSNNIIDNNSDIFDDSGLQWLENLDPTLNQSTSLIDAASDGGDIGALGGSNPYNRTGQSLPTITDLIAPLSIKVGTNTEVTIKAKGN
ncbi:MAG: hypothetical protein ROO71_05655 [Balneola sp.]